MNLQDLLSIIDTGADSIIRDVVGERAEEYRTAEAEATAYRADGYVGTPPRSVKSWADAKGWTGQQACDDILRAADEWRDALALMRDKRLSLKERARTGEDKQTLLAEWLAFDKVQRANLGV